MIRSVVRSFFDELSGESEVIIFFFGTTHYYIYFFRYFVISFRVVDGVYFCLPRATGSDAGKFHRINKNKCMKNDR